MARCPEFLFFKKLAMQRLCMDSVHAEMFADAISQCEDGEFADTDEKVGVSSNDTNPSYLINKLTNCGAIELTQQNDGGDESLCIAHANTSDITNINTSGAQVIDQLIFDEYGHVISYTLRNLTLGDVGDIALSVEDTVTIDLTYDTGILSADVIVSQQPNNLLSVVSDGLYVRDLNNNIAYGGVLTWLQDYDFNVSAAGYYINNVFYTSPSTDLTLDPADPSLDRIDVVYVDNTGSVGVITGTPSLTPSQPGLDLGTQIGVGVIFVEAGSTSPVDLVEECITENVTWTPTASDSSIDPASSNTPCVGVSTVEATLSSTSDYVKFVRSSSFSPTEEMDIIKFYVKPKSDWDDSAPNKLKFTFRLAGTVVGNTVTLDITNNFGFDASNLTCQLVSIDINLFGLLDSDLVDEFRVEVDGSFGWFLDELCLQGGLGTGTLDQGDFIWNQYFGPQPSSNFWIKGIGRADTWFTSPQRITATTYWGGSEKFGALSEANYIEALALGWKAVVNGTSSGAIAIGSQATSNGGLVIGNTAIETGGGTSNTAIGRGSNITGGGNTALGAISTIVGNSSVAIGQDAKVTGGVTGAISIGYFADNIGVFSTGLGYGVDVNHNYSLALGAYATTTAANQLILGGSDGITNFGIKEVYIGTGVTSVTTDDVHLSITGASGSDVAAKDFYIAGSKGTGNSSTGGKIIFQTSDAGVSGSTLQSLTNKLEISKLGQLKGNKYGTGNFTSGTATYLIATDASGNYMEVPSSGLVGGTIISADNGLNMSTATNVQLGGILIKDTDIDADTFQLTIDGTVTGGGITGPEKAVVTINNNNTDYGSIGLDVSSDGNFGGVGYDSWAIRATKGGIASYTSGIAIKAESSTAQGVAAYGATHGVFGQGAIIGVYGYGFPAGAIGIKGEANNTYGLHSLSNTTSAKIQSHVADSPATTVQPVLEIYRTTTGTPDDGIGGSIDFYTQSTTSERITNRIISKFTENTDASRTSQLIITGVNTAVQADLVTLAGTGALKFNKYGINTFAGSAAYALGVDASGNVVEFTAGAGTLTAANNGLSLSSTTVQLGQSVGAGGNPAALLSNREIPMANFTLSFNADATQTNNILQSKNTGGNVRARITANANFSNTGGQTSSEIFGASASVTGINSVAVGANALATPQSVVIGESATNSTSAGSDVIIGKSAVNSNANPGTILIGSNATSTAGAGGGNVIIGTSASSNASQSVSVGYSSTANGANSIVLGANASTTHTYSQVYGFGAVSTAANQLVYGSSNNTYDGINDIYFGRGVTCTVANDIKMQPTGASGSDMAGNRFTIAGSPGTGNAVPGTIKFQTSVPGASGTTLQTLGDRYSIVGKYTTLTESTATAFVRVNVPSGTVAGGELVVTVEANDGTDYQSRTLRVLWTAVNKAGTTTITISTPEEVVATSTGTLTCTITAVDSGSGNIDFKADATSSLTQTVLRASYQVSKNFGTGVISAQ